MPRTVFVKRSLEEREGRCWPPPTAFISLMSRDPLCRESWSEAKPPFLQMPFKRGGGSEMLFRFADCSRVGALSGG